MSGSFWYGSCMLTGGHCGPHRGWQVLSHSLLLPYTGGIWWSDPNRQPGHLQAGPGAAEVSPYHYSTGILQFLHC